MGKNNNFSLIRPGSIFLVAGLAVLLAASACTPTIEAPAVDEELPSAIEAFSSPEVVKVKLENFGRAPEIHNTVWLNTSEALYLKDLRGKVVLLEMWTFGCINCKNVIPSLNEWHDKYQEDGLVIIGNHYPEFAYEREWENVAQAVEDYGIRYPVAQDNEGQTWRAYNNRYWPALFLIDKFGMIRYKHIGEGAYAKTEAAIQALLAEEYVK